MLKGHEDSVSISQLYFPLCQLYFQESSYQGILAWVAVAPGLCPVTIAEREEPERGSHADGDELGGPRGAKVGGGHSGKARSLMTRVVNADPEDK